MNKRKAIWSAVLIGTIAVLCVAGTKISRLTQTTSFQGNSLFLVVTGSQANGTLATRAIEATNMLSQLTNFPGWPPGGGSGSATNVDVRTNANQFGPAAQTLTIKNGVQLTNANVNGLLTRTNGSTYTYIGDNGVFGDNGGIFQVGNFGSPYIQFDTSLDTIYSPETHKPQLGLSTHPYGPTFATNFTATRTVRLQGLTSGRALGLNSNNDATNLTATTTEVDYLSGVSSAIQTQLGNGTNNATAVAGRLTNYVADIATIVPADVAIFEDFERTNSTIGGLTGKYPKKGWQPFYISGVNSNNMVVSNGMWFIPKDLAVGQNASYLTVSNTSSSASEMWNTAWMKIRQTNDTAYGGNFSDVVALVWEPDHNIDGLDIHIYESTGNIVGQVGGTNFLVEACNGNVTGAEIVFGATIISNTVFVQWGSKTYIGTHPAINAEFYTTKTLTWELVGAGTNQFRFAVTEVGAGYASPAMHQLAGRSMTIGTNGTMSQITSGLNVSDTNIVRTALRLPYIATNTLQFIDGNSNVVGLTVGANLSVSGGALAASGGAASTNITTLASGSLTVGTVIASNLVRVGQIDVLTNANLNAVQVTNTLTVGTTNVVTALAGKQAADMVLSNLVGTAARNVTNVVSLSTSNATSKPLSNSYTAGVLTLFGLEQGNNITITPNGSNYVLASTASGSSGGTNYPPVIHNGTNTTIGVGVRQHKTISTNASFGVNWQGTALNGETDRLSVSNYSASVIYWTNFQGGTVTGAFDPSVGSNVTVFAVPALSIRNFEFVWHTNFQANASVRQELQWSSGAEYEFRPGFNGLLETNGLAIYVGAATNQTLKSARIATFTNDNQAYFLGGITQDTGFTTTLGPTTASGLTTATGTSVDSERGNFGRVDVRTNLNAGSLAVTNNASISGTNFVNRLAIPNIATNSLYYQSGTSNASAATIGVGQTLSLGVLSSWLGIATNSGTTVQATQLVARTPSIVLSNDTGGTMSMHVNRSGLYRTIYVDAAAMVSNVTAGATFLTEETAAPTNHMVDSYVFSGSASNVVGFKLAMPLEWDLGTIKVKLLTVSTNNKATTTNIWGIDASAAKNTTTLSNLTHGTELEITNVVSSAGGQVLISPATPALTVGNTPVTAGQLVWFKIIRKPLDADDNDDGQQKLLGAWIQYREKSAEEASW